MRNSKFLRGLDKKNKFAINSWERNRSLCGFILHSPSLGRNRWLWNILGTLGWIRTLSPFRCCIIIWGLCILHPQIFNLFLLSFSFLLLQSLHSHDLIFRSCLFFAPGHRTTNNNLLWFDSRTFRFISSGLVAAPLLEGSLGTSFETTLDFLLFSSAIILVGGMFSFSDGAIFLGFSDSGISSLSQGVVVSSSSSKTSLSSVSF